MFEITKRFTFEAAHQLPWHGGKCKNLHGHSYKLEVSFGANGLNENGIVVDFDDMTRIVNDTVISQFDHKYLNDFMENPTAERISVEIWRRIAKVLDSSEIDSRVTVTCIKLWETEKCSVTLTGLV